MNARKFNFTKARIEALPEVEKTTDFLDTEVSGLQLRKESSGNLTFRVRKYFGGKQQRITLGKFPELPVHQARIRAREVLAEITSGNDLNNSKRETAGARTLELAISDYLEFHSKPHRTEKVYKADVYYAGMIPDKLKRKRLIEIAADDLNRLHKLLGTERGNVTSNKVLKFIHSIYLREKIPSPAAEVRRFKEVPRERYLTEEEIPRFFEAVASYENEIFRDFFLLALFTGLRRQNLQSLQWKHINFNRNLLKFSASEMKNRNGLEVPLISLARSILERRYSNRSESPFVFPSDKSKSGHIEEPKKAWAKIRKQAQIKNLTIHDLRRSIASWMAISNANVFLISKLLGHKSSRSTEIYTRLQGVAPVADALNASATKMLEYAPDFSKGD